MYGAVSDDFYLAEYSLDERLLSLGRLVIGVDEHVSVFHYIVMDVWISEGNADRFFLAVIEGKVEGLTFLTEETAYVPR